MPYVLAIDQGTSSTRALLFDQQGEIRALAQHEINQSYPQPGWVEQDPFEIWQSVLKTCNECIQQSGVQLSEIAGIGITNQRETSIVWNKHSGKPVYPAIVWQSRQSATYIEELTRLHKSEIIRQKTGLIPDAYFSASKISWILDHSTEIRQQAESGDLLFGTVDAWILWQLTGLHATDVSNASRTMLFNIHHLRWDEELLALFRIPATMLPQVLPSSGYFAHTKAEILGASIPICGIAGDQQAALFGQACFQPGEAKNTYGTGCFMLMNTGKTPVPAENGLLSTIAWQINNEICYALEGSVFTAGAALKWLRDSLHLFKSNADIANLAMSVNDNGGVCFVPAFNGLGAPWWDPSARATFLGISAGTEAGHIVRAALEAMAFQSKDVFDLMQEISGIELKTLRVDGGASASDLLMQFQSNLNNVQIERPANLETTATGAAMLAGIAAGIWKNKEEAASIRQINKHFSPQINAEKRQNLHNRWLQAVNATRSFKPD
jgi:glycerol kinase